MFLVWSCEVTCVKEGSYLRVWGCLFRHRSAPRKYRLETWYVSTISHIPPQSVMRCGEKRGKGGPGGGGADTMMMRLWQLELGMSYTNKQSLTEPIFQCWRILIKYLQTAETLADLRVVPYFVAESVSSTWRRCHNCLRLTQPLQRASPSDAATNRKMFPNNNFPVSLQVSKQSQQSVTNNNHPDKIFKTRILQNSRFPPRLRFWGCCKWSMIEYYC